jgi:hypothetical protein
MKLIFDSTFILSWCGGFFPTVNGLMSKEKNIWSPPVLNGSRWLHFAIITSVVFLLFDNLEQNGIFIPVNFLHCRIIARSADKIAVIQIRMDVFSRKRFGNNL